MKELIRFNLWEGITHKSRCNNEVDFQREKYGEVLKALSASASMYQQEITIEVSEDGWIIEIHAAAETGKARILVPKDRNNEIKVLEDTRKDSEDHHTIQYEEEVEEERRREAEEAADLYETD